VLAHLKLLLWYIKGQRANDLVISNTIGDYIESTTPSKLLHNWEQSTVEAEHIIKHLTLKSQTVLDPMMGTGTNGLAALNLGRKFVGIEINPATFEIARSNIGNINNR
jgi:DNA modification methylase